MKYMASTDEVRFPQINSKINNLFALLGSLRVHAEVYPDNLEGCSTRHILVGTIIATSVNY